MAELLARRSTTMRALAMACLLPVPVAFAAPPGLVDSLESASRALFSPPHDVERPLGYLAGDVEPARTVGNTSADAGPTTDTGVVSVPSSKARVRAVSLAGDYDIPAAALSAYREAAATLGRTDPACRVDWALLAGIGRVESDHGRFAGTTVHQDGTTSPRILGLPLDGSPGVAAISDSDGGRLDGDVVWDRAVGPMQFIPTTWSMVAADGDGDGVRDPHDLDDAALAAGVYLCAGDGDLSTRTGAEAAVFRYNHSDEYVALVLSLAKAYRSGVVALPSTPVEGDGTAPTLEEVPDAPVNGERDRRPDDKDTSDTAPVQKSPERKQPTDRDSSPAPSGGETTTPPSDGGTTTPPSDGETTTPPSDGETTPPSDGGTDSGEDGDGSEQTDPPSTEEPEPETVRLGGAVAACDDTFCVTETAEEGDDPTTWTLDLTEVGDDTAAEDFDRDATAESVQKELAGVAERDGTVDLEVQEAESGDIATLVSIVDAEVPATEMTGTLAATDSPDVWTFTEAAADESGDEPRWTVDFSHVDLATTDVDEDGTSLDDELVAFSEQQETTLAVVEVGDTFDVVAVGDLDLEPLEITADRTESDQQP